MCVAGFVNTVDGLECNTRTKGLTTGDRTRDPKWCSCFNIDPTQLRMSYRTGE